MQPEFSARHKPGRMQSEENKHTHTTMKKSVKTVYSEKDSLDRMFIWTLFDDGSARSQEIRFNCGDAARRVQCNWSEEHEAESDMADLISKMTA